jgi:RNA polymerase sigma-70 factor (ECF subfamily)
MGTPLEFESIVERHQGMVFGIAYQRLQDRAAAEELAQDVFLQLHHHLDSLQSPDHVTYWLRRVTSHRCIDYARRRRHHFLSLDAVPEPATPTPPPSDPLLSRRVRALVGELPENARAAVVLRYEEDLTPEEIAVVLDRPVSTVKSQLQRSLRTLRSRMRWAMATILTAAIGAGGLWYRAEERRRQGEEARRQVLLSLNIAGGTLRAVAIKINHEQE